MRRITMLLLAAIILSTSLACAQDDTSDNNTSRDMALLRKKIGQMKREMDLFIKDIVSTPPVAAGSTVSSFGSDVYVDVFQDEKSVTVKADLPGMSKDKINVTLDNDRFLKISGAREYLKNEKAPGVVRQERFSGNFSKVIELPAEVTPVGIAATYKDGVLEVIIPKKSKTAKEESVKINVK